MQDHRKKLQNIKVSYTIHIIYYEGLSCEKIKSNKSKIIAEHFAIRNVFL